MSLYRAIYHSRVADDLRFTDITEIISQAEINNHRDGISGLLAYGSGQFLQIIEGERRALCDLLARLFRDARHLDLDLIEWVEISERRFDGWSMRCCNLDLTGEKVVPMVRKFSGTTTFDPTRMNAGQCLGLLTALSQI